MLAIDFVRRLFEFLDTHDDDLEINLGTKNKDDSVYFVHSMDDKIPMFEVRNNQLIIIAGNWDGDMYP